MSSSIFINAIAVPNSIPAVPIQRISQISEKPRNGEGRRSPQVCKTFRRWEDGPGFVRSMAFIQLQQSSVLTAFHLWNSPRRLVL